MEVFEDYSQTENCSKLHDSSRIIPITGNTANRARVNIQVIERYGKRAYLPLFGFELQRFGAADAEREPAGALEIEHLGND